MKKFFILLSSLGLLNTACSSSSNDSIPQASPVQGLVGKDSQDFKTVQESVTASQEEYLKMVEEMVAINTDTGNMAGAKEITQYIAKKLEPIGAKIEYFPTDKGIHMVARLNGNGEKTVLLYDHYDTVIPNRPSYKPDFAFKYDAEKQIGYGPGTSDSKGSLAHLIQNIITMHNLNIAPYKQLILYIDAQEETGSDMGEKLATDLAKEADYAFVADGGRPNLGIVTKRKTAGTYTITIDGIAGHAGNGAQASASAVLQAGIIINQLNELQSKQPMDPQNYSLAAIKAKGITDVGQFVPANTINVGVVEMPHGGKSNIVADQIVLKIDVRCFEQSEHERIQKAIFDFTNMKTYKEGMKIQVDGKQTYESVEAKGTQKFLADMYNQLAENLLDRKVTFWQAGGVTPGNVIALYTPILDSVGVDANPALEHSVNEELYVDSYIPRSILMIEFLKAADTSKEIPVKS